MIGAPVEANLRGELALEQLRAIQDLSWPGIQSDIENARVVEMPEVEIVPCDEPISPLGSSYGIRRHPGEAPVPISPAVGAFPGRYRAWVLPLSGVAVAVEPLDDEDSYLRAHRRFLFEAQDVKDEAELVPLAECRRGNRLEFGSAPINELHSLFRWATNRFVRAYYEGRFEKRAMRFPAEDPFSTVRTRLYARLVLGTLYRLRPLKSAGRVIDVVVSEERTSGVGPYR